MDRFQKLLIFSKCKHLHLLTDIMLVMVDFPMKNLTNSNQSLISIYQVFDKIENIDVN